MLNQRVFTVSIKVNRPRVWPQWLTKITAGNGRMARLACPRVRVFNGAGKEGKSLGGVSIGKRFQLLRSLPPVEGEIQVLCLAFCRARRLRRMHGVLA